MKKVSVIVPNYNNEIHLGKCIDSILNQEYPEKEIIIIDDSSTDASLPIIREYMKDNKCIKLFKNNHLGPNVARRVGLEKASGKYIMFVDSDDYLGAGAIKTLVEKIERSGVDVVRFESERCSNKQKVAPMLLDGENEKIINHSEIVELLTTGFKLTSLWAKIYRKDVLERIPAFDLDISFGEDLLINKEVLGGLDKMLVISDIFYYYRDIDNNSLTHSTERVRVIENIRDRIFVSNKMIQFINKEIDDDDLKIKAIYTQLLDIWSVMKKIVRIDKYKKEEFIHDFSDSFLLNLEEYDLEKYIKSLDILQRLKNGRAVLAIARMDCCSLWSELNKVRLAKRILKKQ